MSEDKKKTKVVKKKKEKKESFIKGVIKEIKTLKMPSKKDVTKYSISTIIFCVVVAVFFVILTYLLSLVVGR